MEQTLVLCRHRWNNYSDNNVPRCSTRKRIPSQSFRYSNRTLSICFHNSMQYHNCERQNDVKVVQEKYLTHKLAAVAPLSSRFHSSTVSSSSSPSTVSSSSSPSTVSSSSSPSTVSSSSVSSSWLIF
jgi:hypothetical protein